MSETESPTRMPLEVSTKNKQTDSQEPESRDKETRPGPFHEEDRHDTSRRRPRSPRKSDVDMSNREARPSAERRSSRSPRRDKPRRKDAGFKWKAKRQDDDIRQRDRGEGLNRGYRNQYRNRSKSRSRSRSPRRSAQEPSNERRRPRDEASDAKESKKEKKPTRAVPQQEMIVVFVNDRLGTKKAIPCYATDPVKDFKIIVASMIGRQPHEILLKRQGERPFKDMLTLQDYGVSNNVQLDLEVDTGD